jgi:hypothetical protein
MQNPTSKMKKWCLKGAVVLALFAAGVSTGTAVDKDIKSQSGAAIRGLDAVAFQTEKRAVKGKKEFSYQWNDAIWYFKSAENRDLFASDPVGFAPQFDGN